MAVKDAYKAPEVQQIQFEDPTVVVTAKNEFKVAEVEIRVYDTNGGLQETGKAVHGRNGVAWSYTAALLPPGGKVVVIAVELPGNDTVMTVKLE